MSTIAVIPGTRATAGINQKNVCPSGKGVLYRITFSVDYGFNVTIGENFFANNNLTLLDVCPITIGDDVLLAPNVGIYTGHVLDPQLRRETGAGSDNQ